MRSIWIVCAAESPPKNEKKVTGLASETSTLFLWDRTLIFYERVCFFGWIRSHRIRSSKGSVR